MTFDPGMTWSSSCILDCRVALCGSIYGEVTLLDVFYHRAWDVSVKMLHKSRDIGSYEIVLIFDRMYPCVRLSSWGIKRIRGPQLTHGEFLIPGSHSWLLPGWQMETSKCFLSVQVFLSAPPLTGTWRVLKPCRMSDSIWILHLI